MIKRFHILTWLLCVLGVAVMAQPTTEEAFLVVRAVTPAGAPFTEAPAVTAFRMEGAQRVGVPGGYVVTSQNTSMVLAMSPGEYQIHLGLRGYGLSAGPITLQIASGPNTYDWVLPCQVAVQGMLTRDGQPVTPSTVMVAARSATMPASLVAGVTATGSRYNAPGLFPSTYELMVLTEQGYGVAGCTITGQETAPVTAPIALQAGVPFKARVLDVASQAPIAGATVVLQVYWQKAWLRLTLTTDADGTVTTPQLPTERWSYTAVAPGYAAVRGDLIGGKIAAGVVEVPLKKL